MVPPELSPFPEQFPDFVRHFARRSYEVFGDRVTRVVGKGDGPTVVVMIEIDGNKMARHRFSGDMVDEGLEAWDEICVVLVSLVQRDLENVAEGEADGPSA